MHEVHVSRNKTDILIMPSQICYPMTLPTTIMLRWLLSLSHIPNVCASHECLSTRVAANMNVSWNCDMVLFCGCTLKHTHTLGAKRALEMFKPRRFLQTWVTGQPLHMSLQRATTPVKVIGPAADNVLPSVVAASSVASPHRQHTCEDGLYCVMRPEELSLIWKLDCQRAWGELSRSSQWRYGFQWRPTSCGISKLVAQGGGGWPKMEQGVFCVGVLCFLVPLFNS